MKKIVSMQQKERKQNVKQWAVGIVLIVVIMMGIIGGSFQGILGDKDSSKITYNGFEFSVQDNSWGLSSNQGNFIFSYNPKEVDRVEGFLNPINNYYNKPLYIFSENNNAEGEIYQNLFSNLFRP